MSINIVNAIGDILSFPIINTGARRLIPAIVTEINFTLIVETDNYIFIGLNNPTEDIVYEVDFNNGHVYSIVPYSLYESWPIFCFNELDSDEFMTIDSDGYGYVTPGTYNVTIRIPAGIWNTQISGIDLEVEAGSISNLDVNFLDLPLTYIYVIGDIDIGTAIWDFLIPAGTAQYFYIGQNSTIDQIIFAPTNHANLINFATRDLSGYLESDEFLDFTGCVDLETMNTANSNRIGSFPDITDCVNLIYCFGNDNGYTDYVAGTFTNKPILTYIRLDNNAFTKTAIDAIMADCITSLATRTVTCDINISGGTNAVPELADKNVLLAAGWTVTTN